VKVTVLEPYGYCSGVERAMKMAIETKENNSTKNVVVLGMLVHNEDSLRTLEKHGIKTIYDKNCSLEQLVDKISEPSIVILTAHGHSKSVEEKLTEKGHMIIDATCPFVSNSFKEIKKALNKNSYVFYVGVKNHPESTAALSISDKVLFIDYKAPEIPKIDCKSPLVISQTTLSQLEVFDIYMKIEKEYPKAKISKGICHASTSRQLALGKLDADVDLIYVVGGINSNNSRTLFNIAKGLYPNKKVELIQNASEINKKDLQGLSHIAISSGASTPKEVIEEIKSNLLN
jgi:4-hydroxy-3-methylbut-2-enyl diphosphate reductase